MMLDKNTLKNNYGRAVAEFVNTGTGMLVVALYSDKFPIALEFVPGEHITEQGHFVRAQGFAQSDAHAVAEHNHAVLRASCAEATLAKLADFVAENMRDRDVQAPATETMAAVRSGYERCLQDVIGILRGVA